MKNGRVIGLIAFETRLTLFDLDFLKKAEAYIDLKK